MSSPLYAIWDTAAGQPYQPFIPKNGQFTVGAILLFLGLILTGVFGINRSLVNVPVLGIPASLAFGFGAVYMICAVGVYV